MADSADSGRKRKLDPKEDNEDEVEETNERKKGPVEAAEGFADAYLDTVGSGSGQHRPTYPFPLFS